MSEVGRNDPCPCGSGRKAKNCCHRPAVPAAKLGSVMLPGQGGAPARRVPLSVAILEADRHLQRAQFNLAEPIYKLVLAADAEYPDALFFLGVLQHQTGRSAEGVELMRKAIALKPNNRLYHYNLAKISDELGRLTDAIALYQRSIDIEPNADACNNLAGLLLDHGKLDEAVKYYELGVALEPEDVPQQSNLLYALHYKSNPDLQAVFEEHKKFGERHERAIERFAPRDASMEGSTDRPLRLGYISSDFRQHSVAHLIEPVLAAHDKARFEVFCYYNCPVVDAVTRRIEKLVPHWRAIFGRSDPEVANMIRADRIDILVDLSGHTPIHRLLMFARKPAPVQATWIGYPNTTGLTTMDYRITDAIRDPVGVTDAFHTEKLVRLPDTCSCYQPPPNAPEVGPLPVSSTGAIMFGSFNKFTKMNRDVLETWAALLRRVAHSRLTLKYKGFQSPSVQSLVIEAFARHGVGSERLVFLGSDDYRSHLQHYNSIDIGLDPFPHNGDLTTCDALWMGVPVVALAGRSYVGRMGASRLTNIGLAELIGRSKEDYVDIAAALANDVPRLAALRSGLRARMSASPLMDPERLTRHLERAYQEMWANR